MKLCSPRRVPAGRTAPLLKIEIMDIVTVSAGGPTIVVIHAVLERPGLPAVHFKGMRQMHIQHSNIKAETTECSAMDAVIQGLGADLATWMLKPVDGGVSGGRGVSSARLATGKV
jgi:hypothetical protein